MKRYSAKSKAPIGLLVIGTYLMLLLTGTGILSMYRPAIPHGLAPVPTVTTAPVLDVSTLPPCPGEAGPVDQSPRLACTWDAATQGTMGPRLYSARWLVYLPVCPEHLATVQNGAMVKCIDMSDWGE